ncbi:hypothetical protein CXG81DRAFT_14562 [Caulochytrium protostelioides]|uniref:Glycoside hydrolase n=1 Tax=Caulochytrium protostelioides TaxID=1555241 RepID=A0A4P9X0S0_9FUNG|nr:glycoside hydrolase [Caulochytrium protostelioides]RKO99404.1 hypothetical protein CXG81DRAFT_14562 [Caulochytrium protostelioides]|eukprot:RKO99404.1 hypothetical protein CXG81DRAFT_14562 [Caulochytrium protostelioides]
MVAALIGGGVVVALALGLGLGLGLRRHGAGASGRDRNTSDVLLHPAPGSLWVGASPDWSRYSVKHFDSAVQNHAIIYDAFFHLSDALYTPGCRFNTLTNYQTDEPGDCFDFIAEQVKATGAIMSISLMPDVVGFGLAEIIAPDSSIPARFAAKLKSLADADPRLRMMVRFGHEMNGNWYTYAGHPAEYVQAFRVMATAVRRSVPDRVAFIWSPNANMDYPWGYTGVDSQNLEPGSRNTSDPRFELLDTNGDGVFDHHDDFASPYYPGDEYADWVGLSVYYYNFTDKTQNAQVTPGFVYQAITVGSQTDAALYPNAPNFIQQYSVAKNKPFMISETSAPSLNTSTSAITALDAKSGMWEQVWNASLTKEFPTYHGGIWFDYAKEEGEGKEMALRDFRVTDDPEVRSNFAAYLKKLGERVTWARG